MASRTAAFEAGILPPARWSLQVVVTITIALKSTVQNFCGLLTVPWSVSNMYAQVAKVQLCANHAQHIECLSPASCHMPPGTKGKLSY